MSNGLTFGAVLPDYELPDDTGTKRKLSELQGENAMVLQLGRGEHCPRERQHHKELLKLQELLPVAFTTLVTILPNDLHDTNKMKIATGAWWTFLSDGDFEVQRTLEIDEYTDPHHPATVPHTLILAPGLVVDNVYCGYWFWGVPRPTNCGRTCRTCSVAPSPTSTPPRPKHAPPGRRLRVETDRSRRVIQREPYANRFSNRVGVGLVVEARHLYVAR